jgi:hypothetical protein
VILFENGVLKKLFGPKREELKKAGENFLMRNFIICTLHLILLWTWVRHVANVRNA